MTKGTAIVKSAHFNSLVLHKHINIDGEHFPVTIYGASNEQFDIFVYHVLGLMYMQPEDILKTYNTFAPDDWSDRQDRINAMNVLHDLNNLRKKRSLKAIPLLAEEETAA